jgi:peptidoglycan pentaglycine glycine transferase (the first glycine)
MNIRIQTDVSPWDEWLVSHDARSFLQSFAWGEFQAARHGRVKRFVFEQANQVIGRIQGFEKNIGFGVRYLYVPRFTRTQLPQPDAFFSYCKKQGYAFVRCEPVETFDSDTFAMRSIAPIQPSDTLVVSLDPSDDQLRAAMHPKTRYNIRLAERKGVIVQQKKDINVFWNLHARTAERDGFSSHPREYYAAMLDLDMVTQWNARLGGEYIASNICIAYGDTFTYLHGASADMHRNVMAPYMLQWSQMMYAKARRCRQYDFWGIAPLTDGQPHTSFHTLSWNATHSLTGVTRFKGGFGGERETYGKAIDVILRPTVYTLYRTARSLRSK